MKTRTLIGVLALLVVSLGVHAQSGDEAKVIALENAWNTAQRDHDNVALEAILAETFIDTEADGTVMNRGQFLASVKDPNIKHIAMSNTDVKVVMFGKSALVTGIYHDKGTEKGKPYEVQGRFTDTWVFIDGRWQCVATASTPLPVK